VLTPEASRLEKRLTWLWCAGAGLLFAALIGIAYLLELSGRVVNLKIWFVVCAF
jgi:hypothetical protein